MSTSSAAAASPGAAAAAAPSFAPLAGLPLFLDLASALALAVFADLPALEFLDFFALSSLTAVLAAEVRAEADLAGEAAAPLRLAAGLAAVAEPRAVADLDEVLLAAAGIADDMALVASVSDFTAVSIALVAVLIARSALVIVLAESVAWVAAVFSFAAALVTFVAADDTARGDEAVAAVVARRVVVFVAVVPVARVPVERFAVVRAEVVLAALVRPELARWRAGLEAAVSVGTDLPQSRSVTGKLIPRSRMFYTW